MHPWAYRRPQSEIIPGEPLSPIRARVARGGQPARHPAPLRLFVRPLLFSRRTFEYSNFTPPYLESRTISRLSPTFHPHSPSPFPIFLRDRIRGDLEALFDELAYTSAVAPVTVEAGACKRQPEEGFSLLVSAYRFSPDAPLEFYRTRVPCIKLMYGHRVRARK